ncbi:MAG: iron-sulfur binding hydrogenase [Spirochaetia bacterium]|nr:iron-sulfur binding hydrogenase [Spirochaetia bacterium]
MSDMLTVSKKLGYKVVVMSNEEAIVTGGYAGDLLSDVMGHAQEGEILITIQAHKNSIAVASLLGLSGIIICNSRDVSDDMKLAAKEQGITLFTTSDTQYRASIHLASVLA